MLIIELNAIDVWVWVKGGRGGADGISFVIPPKIFDIIP